MAVQTLDDITRLTRRQVAWRTAHDIEDGWYVNLGIGMPTMCSNYLPEDREIVLQSENGVLGVGPNPPEGEEDPDLVNASKQLITLLKGGSYVSHVDSFTMIRGGHLDLALLGAFEVSEAGDLANWTTNDPKFPPGVGGAMDLAVGAKRIWVLTEHCTRQGEPKLVKACTYPLTAAGVVKRVYTDLAVLELGDDGVVVLEMVPGLTLETLQAVTGPELRLADDWRELVAPEVG
ncbi:MAG: 3-oxoacid CoA-transferase subunit B [Rhodospirillaceae bacterium]|jgi:3-oxoadipate CoA-transferase, beta subunit|nr:3-oxoacid CoA-transferase subunit B [Rhodospirillaceae bacterium]MBT6136722.1 3-oxoacid CoA-transferase subunit B [Rhodospirillaceae bacterium]